MGIVTFFILEIPDTKFAMLVYLYIPREGIKLVHLGFQLGSPEQFFAVALQITDFPKKLFKMKIFSIKFVMKKDSGRSLEQIFMKITRLMRVHPWVNPIVFENNWHKEP